MAETRPAQEATGDAIRVIAGECTTEFLTAADGVADWRREREQHGRVLTVVKPDGTTLVHDADGYQPVAWLTRPETTVVEREPTVVTATDGDSRLRVRVHDAAETATHPISTAGTPVGDCPDCHGRLVRSTGGVDCVGCGDSYALPAGATVLDERCADCDAPLCRVERGEAFELCIDRACDPLDEAVREALDREWDCPACGAPLRVLRRGGLLLGCDAYPDCEVGVPIPQGTVTGTCDCGLPRFATESGERCPDRGCQAAD